MAESRHSPEGYRGTKMQAARRKGHGNQRRGSQAGGEGLWHQPVLLNLLADLLLLLGGVLIVWEGAQLLQRLPLAPLKQVTLASPLVRISPAQIEHVARTSIAGNFFTVDLERTQAAFEQLPWVRRASVRRLWPDGIELVIEEQHPVARWTPLEGAPRLVNAFGEVFNATVDEPLPVFSGAEGSAPRILAEYRELAVALAGIGHAPVAVRLSPRDAWQLMLDDGVMIELGRDQPRAPLAERLQRFTAHYAAMKARMRGLGGVDMRYPNGFALIPVQNRTGAG